MQPYLMVFYNATRHRKCVSEKHFLGHCIYDISAVT